MREWLLRACADTRLGERLVPILERVLATLSSLQYDLPRQWPTAVPEREMTR